MVKLVLFSAATTSIFTCYLIRFENWQGHGLSALLLGCSLLLILFLVSRSFSHQIASSSNIFKKQVASLFAPTCFFGV
ncbi:hypothetical protein CJF42_12775 [Pseudoalteromonas sp. NBT06-2]|uniref:hypothetical protein n=1 Tax=Pseudoalteromonas sp. NBT06-2 TaxID=2025950 RepID=UPI000BA57CA3|nr:hypothetical protein [Pseudoalteromonas sp. NBT06-2]PAJ74017.1 hypothetical protein CJF42_12775 [Pseudoalteromonas sp. NBT06-2]